MALLDILTYPNPLLKQAAQPVSDLDAVRQLIADLNETLEYYPGCVGVAAPQTGQLLRVIVIDASRNRKPVSNRKFRFWRNIEKRPDSGRGVSEAFLRRVGPPSCPRHRFASPVSF